MWKTILSLMCWSVMVLGLMYGAIQTVETHPYYKVVQQ